jgi:hypothetical protein
MFNRRNIIDIYKDIKDQKLSKNKFYVKILDQCYTKVNRAVDNKLLSIFYEVPVFFPGLPKYDVKICTAYVMNDLRNSGFVVVYLPPRNIYISWNPKEVMEHKTFKNIKDINGQNQLMLENEVHDMTSYSKSIDPHKYSTKMPRQHNNFNPTMKSTNNKTNQINIDVDMDTDINMDNESLDAKLFTYPKTRNTNNMMDNMRIMQQIRERDDGDDPLQKIDHSTNLYMDISDKRSRRGRGDKGVSRYLQKQEQEMLDNISMYRPPELTVRDHNNSLNVTSDNVKNINSLSMKTNPFLNTNNGGSGESRAGADTDVNFPIFGGDNKVRKKSINDFLLNEKYIGKKKDIDHKGRSTLNL